VSDFFTTICARCITLVALSFQHLLDNFYLFIYFYFYHFGNLKKNPEIPTVEVGKKMPCQVSLRYLGNMYNTLIISMLPLKKHMSNTWLELYVQLGIT